MAVIKVRRSNGDMHEFALTTDINDTDNNYIMVRQNGTTFYARTGSEWTPLVVRRSNGNVTYVQKNPIAFSRWEWSSDDLNINHRMTLYLPRGRYRITYSSANGYITEVNKAQSGNVEINVFRNRANGFTRNITYQISDMLDDEVRQHSLYLLIERIGNI